MSAKISRERVEELVNNIAEGESSSPCRFRTVELFAAIAMLADDRAKAWEEFNGLRNRMGIMFAESLGVKHPNMRE